MCTVSVYCIEYIGRLKLAGLNLRDFQLPGCKLQNHCKIYAVDTATEQRESAVFDFGVT